MYDNDYEGEVIENEFDDSGVVFEKPIELDIFAEDAWDDTALLAAFHESLTLHPESNSTESYTNKRGKIEPEEAPRKRVVRHSPAPQATERLPQARSVQSPSARSPSSQPSYSPQASQQQHQARNTYYQDYAQQAAQQFHHTNTRNTFHPDGNHYSRSPHAMFPQYTGSPLSPHSNYPTQPQYFQQQQGFSPPQPQPYHSVHMDKALADLLLSWYQSGYQAGRYHALREISHNSRSRSPHHMQM